MPHELFTDEEMTLKQFFGDRNPFFSYIKRIRTKMPLGADITGSILARMQAMWDVAGLGEMADRLLAAPGDRTLNYGDDNVPARVGLGMPIAYDIWYLYPAGNVLEFGGKTIAETMTKLEAFFNEIDGAKPLKSPETALVPGPYTLTVGFGGGMSSVGPDSLGSVQYTVKEARYEVMLTGKGEDYASEGPKERQSSYVGYIAFPVGPLGVMWAISLATESALDAGISGSVYPLDAQSATVQGGDLLPPFNLDVSKVVGEKLMSKGWLVEDDTKIEILASDFGAIDNPALHYWLRYWIKPDNTEIVPGEFVGLLCRPWPLHCWWFQETAPFLYAGHWIETEFYTSGTVKEVIEPEEGETGNRYRIWVKNEEIIVQSTDFFEYEVDERVGLLKTWREGEGTSYSGMGPVNDGSGQESNFNWQNLALLNTGSTLTTEWVIVPAGFYE